MKTRWDAGLSAHRYEELMTQLQRDVGLGVVECLPDFHAFETAIQAEHRCRACASLIAKLAERAYRPALQVLASLTKESVANGSPSERGVMDAQAAIRLQR